MSGNNVRGFKYWQWRTILATMVGYALFYVVRKNFSIAMATPDMGKELGWTNTQIGCILTSFSLLYGVARFGNGVLADRINARYFMVTGLVCAAATASGLTGTFGYASGLVSGVFLGWLMDVGGDKGTVYVLAALIVLALVGMGTFILAWPARAHGYCKE